MGRVVRTLKHGWNVFKASENPSASSISNGPMVPARPNRQSARYYSDKSILGSIYNRLAVDFAQVEFYHAKLDDQDVAIDVVRDSLNDCLTLDPNIDQTAQAMKIDLALTMFESGIAAVVPTDADLDPAITTSYDIRAMRVATVAGWYPRKVAVNLYDDREFDDEGNRVNGGVTKQITVPKLQTALIENPFYAIMNEPNGTLQRLKAKLSLLDGIDEAAGSGKLDMLIQLPYSTRMTNRQKQAEERRDALRQQLKDDELGVGYIDINEKVIQLNRPVENKLLDQIKELYDQLYAELGLTPEIMNGIANRDTINNYFDRTIEPIANAVSQEYKRKFLTKTARSENYRHSIETYRDPLKLIPITELAEVVDKVTRSAVATANDIRPKIGLRPSKDPQANKLGNPNMPAEDQLVPNKPPAPKEVSNGQGLPVNGKPIPAGR
jgi:hypothetical protein